VRKDKVLNMIHPIMGGIILIAVVTWGILNKNSITSSFSPTTYTFLLFALISELLFLPRISILLAAGFFFHPIYGGFLTILSDLVAAAIVWAFGSTSFGKTVAEILDKKPKLHKIKEYLLSHKLVETLTILRIAPFAHYSSISLISGSCRVNFPKYMLGTFLGLIPTALIYPHIAKYSMNSSYINLGIMIGLLVIMLIIGYYILKPATRIED
jgi:uncharacterized membrane protein YdjX (TVP38/TMEM64 family)